MARIKKPTSLALGAWFGGQHHIVAISRKTSRTVTHEATRKSLPSLHRLHGQILTHAIGNCVAVLSSFNTLLRQMLYLGSPRCKLGMYFCQRNEITNRFWNHIWTERSVMLISWAMRSRTTAVGVGFLLNSASKVTSCSCVALWRFWFFCCCVSVLFRGGRREPFDWEGCWCAGGEGEGVVNEDILWSVIQYNRRGYLRAVSWNIPFNSIHELEHNL